MKHMSEHHSERDHDDRQRTEDSSYKRKRSPSPPPSSTSKTKEDEYRGRRTSPPSSNGRESRERDRDRWGTSSRDNYYDRDHDRKDGEDGRQDSGRDNGRPSGIPIRGVHAQRNEGDEGRGEAPPAIPKEQPNYQPSGKLAAEQNTYKGVVLKYSEPPEARKSVKKWRLYVFKGKEQVDLLHVHRQSAYLVGRERLVADIPIDHPSCSKQHAVLQYRQVSETSEFGDTLRVIKPYLIDLESANGTFLNGDKIEASRYYELKAGDTVKFGFSSRDYVLLNEDAS